MIDNENDGVSESFASNIDSNLEKCSVIHENIEREQIEKNEESIMERDEDSDDDELFINKSTNRKKLILSDDDDEESSGTNQKKAILSDDDNEESDGERKETPIVSKEFLDEDVPQIAKNRIILNNDSDSEDDRNSSESMQKSIEPKTKYRSDIFDTETTDDEENYSHNDASQSEMNNYDQEMEHKGSIKVKKKEKQSSKKRKENLKEIHSTTQKIVRESQVVLPYHIPRQRKLLEFLNRKKSVPQLEVASQKRKSLIMSMNDINHIEEMQERMKSAHKFYDEDNTMENTEIAENDCGNSTNIETLEMETIENNDTPADEDSLTELPDLNTIKNFEEEKREVQEKMNEMTKNENEKDKDGEKDGEKLFLEERLSIERANVDLSCSVKPKINEVFDENNIEISESLDEFSCADSKTISKVDKSVEKEEKAPNSQKIRLFDEDSDEEFRLHLDTEDFDTENMLNEESSQKSNHQDIDASGLDSTNSKSRLSLLASKFPELDLGNLIGVTPRLSLGEGAFIELDEPDTRKKTGVDELLDRFVEHSKKVKTPRKSENVSLGIVSKEVSATGEEKLVHSNVTVTVAAEEEDRTKCDDTPGARYTLLKKALTVKMLEQREKNRQRREKEKEFLDSEKVIEDYHDDGLPDEEAELTDKSETDYETESEPEENDVIIQDKKRKKNKYLDEEAEVDEDDEDNVQQHNNFEHDYDDVEDGENDTEMMDEDDKDNIEDNGTEDEENEIENKLVQKRKLTCRIIDDDDEEDNCIIAYKKSSETDFNLHSEDTQEVEVQEENTSKKESGGYSMSRANTEELFTSQIDEENALNSKKELTNGSSIASMDHILASVGSLIPAGQQSRDGFQLVNKMNPEVSVTDNLMTLLTPFSNLENITQDNFTRENSDKECHSALNFLLTPLKATQVASQVPCSNTDSIRSLLLDTPTKLKENVPSTNPELLGLCSGTFAAAETCSKTLTENNFDDELIGLCSGKFATQKEHSALTSALLKPTQGIVPSFADTIILSGDDEKVADGTDEVDTCHQTEKQQQSPHSSDEESENKEKIQPKKIKKRKRILNLDLSDEEEANLPEDGKENNVWSSDEDELMEMEFDENEVPIMRPEKFTGFKDAYKGGIRADFLDKEAELSGSEEGSADEDEPDEDNDIMEQEEGDLERFDEQELRDQVGRAHLKSLIDSDKRELRLLQEMYLENGDLQGEGRQRKFRWRNVDSQIDDGENRQSDEEEKEEELEEEAEWRRLRFEREKFLEEKKGEKEEVQPSEVLNEEINQSSLQKSSSLKLVKNLSLRRSISTSSSTHSQDSPFLQNGLKKRGSFITRDDNTLQRLANFTKENVNTTVGGARQSGNFVFQTLTEEEVEKRSRQMEAKKEKGRTMKPPEKKRMRVERSFFSMEETVQSSSVFKHL